MLAQLLNGWRLSREFSLAVRWILSLSSIIWVDRISPSRCIKILGLVFYTEITALRILRTILSIILHRCKVWGVTVSLAVGRVIPGHHTSDQNIATDNMNDSTALTSVPWAAPLFTELIRHICSAVLRAFAHRVITWCLKLRSGSRWTLTIVCALLAQRLCRLI